jgi:glucokinase
MVRTVGASAPRHEFTVLAADIGGTKIDVALAESTGALLDRNRISTRAAQGPEQALRRLAEAFAELLSRNEAHPDVVAVAVACPGVVQQDRILLAPNLPGWEGVRLAQDVASATGFAHVVVTNDVKAGALAELRFGGLRGLDPGLFLNLGTGLASAFTVGGRVVEGANNAAGEIGYVRPGGSPALSGPKQWAALEDLVGGRAISARAADVAGPGPDGAHLFQRSDAVAQHLVHSALAELGVAVSNLCVILNPQGVVVGGGMMAAADVILPVLRAHVNYAVPFPPTIEAATFSADAPLRGAVALAIDAAVSKAPAVTATTSGVSP